MKNIGITTNGESILTAVTNNGLATLHDHGIYGIEETALHLQAISQIGTAWGISESKTKAAIDAITDAQCQVIKGATDSDITVMERRVPIGREELMETIHGLLQTVIILEQLEQRTAMMEFVTYLWEINNLSSPLATETACA